MFFVVWGKKKRSESQGVVVDLCAHCRELRPFSILDHFVASHLYYVSLGRGEHTGRTRVCTTCGKHTKFDPTRYAQILTVAAAESASVEQGLEMTNPGLRHRMAEHHRLDAFARRTADSRLIEAIQWLRYFESLGAKNEPTLLKLGRWTSLPDAEKNAILDELRRTGERVRKLLAA